MTFRFVVKNLRWLAAIPGLPQVYDAMLLIATALCDRDRLRAMELFEQFAMAEPGVRIRPHRFGGSGFFIGSREVCHLHGNGLFDAFVGRKARMRMLENGEVLKHHVYPNSGWISFPIKTDVHVSRALDLMRVACAYGFCRTS